MAGEPRDRAIDLLMNFCRVGGWRGRVAWFDALRRLRPAADRLGRVNSLCRRLNNKCNPGSFGEQS
jgi:hypothetical protein